MPNDDNDSNAGTILDMLRKGLFTGLGAALLTKDMIEQTVNNLVSEGKVTKDEAARIVDELIDKGRKELSDLQNKTQSHVKSGLNELNIATKQDHDTLLARVEQLEMKFLTMDIRLNAMAEKMPPKTDDAGDEG